MEIKKLNSEFIKLYDDLIIRADIIERIYISKESISFWSKPDYIIRVDFSREVNGSHTQAIAWFDTEEKALEKFKEIENKLFTNN